jgi:glycosyltransferase involved in cell wall biosynthesis
MHWTVAAAFTFNPQLDRWLVPYVSGNRHSFTMIGAAPAPTWHERSRALMGLRGWANVWSQGRAAWSKSEGGVITVFPQLAIVVGAQQRYALTRKPVVAWCFNVGALYQGLKERAARIALARIDRFVVHSKAEVARCAKWLALPVERFRFVHLQRAAIPITEREEEESPFVLAMGSARRDYATLFEALRKTKFPTVVVAAPHAISGLSVPNNVTIRSALSPQECRLLAQRARVNVVPVLNEETASGQVTLLEAMRMGRSVVATRCVGSEDYIEDNATGLLVEPRSVEDLGRAIERLWDDSTLRLRLGQAAQRFAAEHCSDAAAGESLRRILDEVETARGCGT